MNRIQPGFPTNSLSLSLSPVGFFFSPPSRKAQTRSPAPVSPLFPSSLHGERERAERSGQSSRKSRPCLFTTVIAPVVHSRDHDLVTDHHARNETNHRRVVAIRRSPMALNRHGTAAVLREGVLVTLDVQRQRRPSNTRTQRDHAILGGIRVCFHLSGLEPPRKIEFFFLPSL